MFGNGVIALGVLMYYTEWFFFYHGPLVSHYFKIFNVCHIDALINLPKKLKNMHSWKRIKCPKNIDLKYANF